MTDQTMIERVAKALHHLEAAPHADGTSFVIVWDWGDVIPSVRERHMEAARAALEAMRNPPHEIRIIAMMQGWNAAIDAALEGGE